jgi:hypothetical protein
MADRLVCNCIQILRLLLDGPTNVNSVIKQTGLYKNYVFEANKTLKKAELGLVETRLFSDNPVKAL